MTEEKHFGFNSLVLERSVGKRFVECVSGKGGLAAVVMFLDQLSFIKGIEPLLNDINRHYLFYDMALTKCAKEALKRPEFMREEEIAELLGFVCEKCGKASSIMSNGARCGCNSGVVPYYVRVVQELLDLDIVPSPEAVLLSVAYDGLAEAYVSAFLALRLALQQISEQFGWVSVSAFVDVELKDQLDTSFLYLSAGDTRVALQEREVLQFLVRGNVAVVDLEDAYSLIRLGVATVKFGHLYNQLFSAGADLQFRNCRAEFSRLYNRLNEQIRLTTYVSKKEREERTIEVLELKEKQYYPVLLMPKACWVSGRLTKRVELIPIVKWKELFTTDKRAGINNFVGPTRVGKSTAMAAVIAHAFEYKQQLMVNILGDEANSLTLAGIPLFPCGGYTADFIKILADMGVVPHKMPVVNFTLLRDSEKIPDSKLSANPPTVFDYVVEIPDTYTFGLDFENKSKDNPGVVNVLAERALALGFKRVCGLINFRNLWRVEDLPDSGDKQPKKTNRDIEIATILMEKFFDYRQDQKFPSARLIADELSYLGSVIHARSGTATFQSTSVLSQVVKRLGKLNCSGDFGTQKWSEINTDVRAEATNIIFRELPKAGDKSSSQLDIVLKHLDLKAGKMMRETLASVIERGILPYDDFYWFWWNKYRKDVEVVKPIPPFFMMNQPKKTNLEIFRAYEKFSGERVLLKSWDEVPRLRYASTEYVRRSKYRVA